MTRDSFLDFTEAVAPDFDADLGVSLNLFVGESAVDLDRIIRESTPTDWKLGGDPEFFRVP
jgi:hypothetical protein